MEPPQVSPAETAELLRLAHQVLLDKVEGDFVELGCYKGETSLLLAKLLKDSHSPKRLWLYDSFAGLPDKSSEDASSAGDAFRRGELFVSKREVVEKFRRANLPLPIIKKAFFSDLNSASDLPAQISFAFLDGDLYDSIKTSLALVVPRLAPGALVIVHDFNNPSLPGAAKAVEEFLAAHPNFHLSQRFSLALLREA